MAGWFAAHQYSIAAIVAAYASADGLLVVESGPQFPGRCYMARDAVIGGLDMCCGFGGYGAAAGRHAAVVAFDASAYHLAMIKSRRFKGKYRVAVFTV